MNFEDLAGKIQELLESRERVVVAVCGFGGSGKTTLAEKLKLKFSESNLIQIDNFLINRGQGEGWRGGYDWNRFEAVLKDVRDGKDLHYKFYDWHKDDLSDGFIDEKLQKIVIVEGSRILQSKIMEYYDLSIWIDIDLIEATGRGKQRDERNWEDKTDQAGLRAHLDTWHSTWAPKDKEYYEKFHPDKIADFVYNNR